MSLRTAVGAWCALLCWMIASPARASAISDFKAGSGVFIEAASILLDGQFHLSTGSYLAKPPGTLDLTIAASDLGLNVNATLLLQGRAMTADTIEYTFNQTFSPPVDLGGGITLTNGTGLVHAKVSLIPGANSPLCDRKPCSRNVYLQVLPGGQFFLQGDGWSRTGSGLAIKGVGGVPQPSLDDFVIAHAERICSSETSDTRLPLSAFITSGAPAGGAKIDFVSSHPLGIKVPPHQVIGAGQSMTSFNATVKAGFSGSLTLSASANGATLRKPVEIHREADCESTSGGALLATWVPDLLVGCTRCAQFIEQNDIGGALANVAGRYTLVKRGAVIDVARRLGNESADVVALSNNGLITGTLTTAAGARVAYRASLEHGVGEPQVLGDMTPAGINSFGVVVGHRSTASGTVAVYDNGQQRMDLPLTARGTIVSSQATAVNDAGHVIGTYQDSEGVTHGFRLKGNTTHDLPVVGPSPTIPVAVNRRGEVVARTTDAAGRSIALHIDANLGARVLAPPEGFTQFQAKSINRVGWIVGTASNGSQTRAFLYRQGSGMVDLSTLAPRDSQPFEALEALRITDSNQIVVLGTLDGVTDLYVLSL